MPPLRVIRRNYTRPHHQTSFGGLNRIQKYYGITKREATRVLDGIPSYSLHREIKKPRYRNPYFIYYKRQQVQADLVEVGQLARANGGYKYLLVAIDLFTKYAVCIPMKNKTAIATRRALIEMIRQFGDEKPEMILTDSGKEFKNALVRNYLQNLRIKHVIPSNDFKAAIVERVNKTIQRKIYHYMTAHGTDEFMPALDQIMRGYNNAIHSTINISPKQAENPRNHLWVRDLLNRHYMKILSKRKKPSYNKFKVGDTVRIAVRKDKFHRSYHEQNKEELYEIIGVDNKMPIEMYDLRSHEDLEDIEGSFYASELTKIEEKDFIIEKVLKRRTYRGVRQVFVKWRYYNQIHNSWISERRMHLAFPQLEDRAA